MDDSSPGGQTWELLRKYDGVPRWWAEVLSNVGLSVDEAETFVLTAQRDPSSPLRKQGEAELNASLRAYAQARGITLLGVGAGDGVGAKEDKRGAFGISTIATAEEQAKIEQEVSGYADVIFRDRITGVYTEHAVANGVRSVHQSYGRKMAPSGSRILEPGASVRALVNAGVEPGDNHACCPVLDVRDSVRNSIDAFLEGVVRDPGAHKASSVKTAKAALDKNSGFVCRNRVQECNWGCDYIFSNESNHDIPFGDLPGTMARHGARTWVGFMARANGYRQGFGTSKGRCPLMGTRWAANEREDTITFHFARDACFSYTHKLSEWIKYERHVEYRWRGNYFDYIYSRLPITTKSSLAFMVSRVPKVSVLLKNPVYLPTGQEGMVKITSIKVVGGCIGVGNPKFEPFVFNMERLAYDKVFENRMTLGVTGNLASTIAYMRSVRVRMYVNGVALGATQVVPSDILESAAVAVEAGAFDCRESMVADYSSIMNGGRIQYGLIGRMFRYFLSCTTGTPAFTSGLQRALHGLADKDRDVKIMVEPCGAFERIELNSSEAFNDGALPASLSCDCMDYADVMAALAVSDALPYKERRELEDYRDELKGCVDKCELHRNEGLVVEQEEYYDAVTELKPRRTEPVVSDSGLGTSICTSDVCSEDEPDEVVSSKVVDTIKEYAEWAVYVDKCARSESTVAASVLFMSGNPTLEDVERSTTPRTRHAVVAIVNGEVQSVIGTMTADEKFSEVYSLKRRKFLKVYGDVGSQQYVKEHVTELCYTSSLLCVLNGDMLSRGAYRVLQNTSRLASTPKVKFVNGVPGCGKTTTIVSKMRELVMRGESVYYLTTTVASKDKVLRDLAGSPGISKRNVRTFDSFLSAETIDMPERGIGWLFLDEVPMSHAGCVWACVFRVAAKNVEMYGDFEQIQFQSFTTGFPTPLSSLRGDVEIESWVVTHRFGEKTCAMWLDVYDQLYPCGCHEHSDETPEVIRVVSTVGIDKLQDGKLLCFTQEEKATLRREMRYEGTSTELRSQESGGMSTVGEDQGGSHNNVVVVRILNKKNPRESEYSPSIYNKQPWVLVASTRHKSKLVYYTVADGDLLSSRIALASCPVRLRAVRERKRWSEVNDGSAATIKFGAWTQVTKVVL